MSRSGYVDNLDTLDLGRWRGQVASAMRGRRGQELLRDLLAALDAMPSKRLIAHELIADGEVCALGAVGVRRGIDMTNIDPDEPCDVAAAFNVAEQLAREIVYINDEAGSGQLIDGKWQPETPERRWERVREWVAKKLAGPQREDYSTDEWWQKAVTKWKAKQLRLQLGKRGGQ